MTVFSRAVFTVPAGNVDEFTVVARELAAAGAAEPGTLSYRWFRGADPSVFVAMEEYVDQAAAFAHNDACASLLEQAFRLGEMTSVQIHGELGDELAEWIAGHPQAEGFVPLT